MSEQERPITLFQINEMEKLVQLHLGMLVEQLKYYEQGIEQPPRQNTRSVSRARYEIGEITAVLNEWKERLRNK